MIWIVTLWATSTAFSIGWMLGLREGRKREFAQLQANLKFWFSGGKVD